MIFVRDVLPGTGIFPEDIDPWNLPTCEPIRCAIYELHPLSSESSMETNHCHMLQELVSGDTRGPPQSSHYPTASTYRTRTYLLSYPRRMSRSANLKEKKAQKARMRTGHTLNFPRRRDSTAEDVIAYWLAIIWKVKVTITFDEFSCIYI